MHLVLMTRGILRQVEELKSLLQAQRFPFSQKNLTTGQWEHKAVQGALRPIQFWEYVFPEESLNDVIAGLGCEGPIKRKELLPLAWAIRKMMKLEQVPEIGKGYQVTGYVPQGLIDGKPIPAQAVHNLMAEGVAVYPVGIKREPKIEMDFVLGDGTKARYYQEPL